MNTVQPPSDTTDQLGDVAELRSLLNTIREILDMPYAGPEASAVTRCELVEARAGAVVKALGPVLEGEPAPWAINYLQREAARLTIPYITVQDMRARWEAGETWEQASQPAAPVEPDPVEPLPPGAIAAVAEQVQRERALGIGGGDQLLGVIAAYDQARAELDQLRAEQASAVTG
jgi:hypothetical protein